MLFVQVPAPPGAGSEDGFEFVNAAEIPASDAPTGDRESVYKRLQEELVHQIKVNIFHICHFCWKIAITLSREDYS